MAAAAGRAHRFVLSSVTSLQLINLILALLPFRCDFEMVHLYSTESKIVRFQKHLKPMSAVLQSQSPLIFKSHLVLCHQPHFVTIVAQSPGRKLQVIPDMHGLSLTPTREKAFFCILSLECLNVS